MKMSTASILTAFFLAMMNFSAPVMADTTRAEDDARFAEAQAREAKAKADKAEHEAREAKARADKAEHEAREAKANAEKAEAKDPSF